MTWAQRRRILYGGAVLIAAVACLVWLWLIFFSAAPTCFDHKQNGGEQGVDCGGPCALLCTAQAHAPQIEWQRALKVSTSTYTAVAYLQNLNPGAGAYNVPYAFRLFDSKNLLVIERDGVINIPPQQTVPLIDIGIDVGSRDVAHTFLEFSGDITWQKIPAADVVKLRVQNITLAPDGSRVTATIFNDGTRDVKNLTVDAVLFDADSTAIAASKSLVQAIPQDSSQQVVFTWPSAYPNAVRAEITPVPELPNQQ